MSILLMMVMGVVVGASDEEWPANLHMSLHNICTTYNVDSWVRAGWDGNCAQVLYQVHPKMFVCGFAVSGKKVTWLMDLLVRQQGDGSIYIKQINSLFFERKTQSQHCIMFEQESGELRLYVMGVGKVVRKDTKACEARQPLALEARGLTLFMTAGDGFNLPVVPQGLWGGKMCFSPVLHTSSVEKRCDIKADMVGAILRSKLSLASAYCTERLANDIMGLSIVHSNSIPISLNPFMLGHGEHVEQRIVVRPDLSMQECFSLKIAAQSSVCIRPLSYTLRTGEECPLWSVVWAGDDGGQQETTVFCDLVCANGRANIALYSRTNNLKRQSRTFARKQYIRWFSFPAVELHVDISHRLCDADKMPYLEYPVAQNFSLALCCGQAADEGPFYICNMKDRAISRTAFLGAQSGGNLWKNIGIPKISFDSSEQYAIAPAALDTSGRNTPLVSFDFVRSPLNTIIFYYNIVSEGGGYCMYVKPHGTFLLRNDRTQEVVIQLSPHDVSTHQVTVQYEKRCVVVHLAPQAYLTLRHNVTDETLQALLNVGSFIQEWCHFTFDYWVVVPDVPMTLPVPANYTGGVHSCTQLRFEGERRKVCLKHVFDDMGCSWERSIQIVNGGAQQSIEWTLCNLQDNSQIVCSTKIAEREEDILLYYMCHANQPSMGQINLTPLACGAVCMDESSGGFFVKKARPDQIRCAPALDEIQYLDVLRWDYYDIKVVPNSNIFPTLQGVLDGQRLQFGFGDHCVYWSPVSRYGDSPFFLAFFADFHIANEEPQQVVVDMLKRPLRQ